MESIEQPMDGGSLTYQFGKFEMDVDRGTLIRCGVELPLRPKSFEVLHYLVTHQGKLISKDQLFDAVWPGVVVTPDSINQCIIEIRRALGDEDRELIRTVPRRGFILEIPVMAAGEAEDTITETPTRKVDTDFWPRRRFRLFTAAMILILIAAVGYLFTQHREPHSLREDAPRVTGDSNRPSIVVLPFTDMSVAGDQGYLADGIAEELLNLLSQLGDLRVISRTSAFAFKGEDVTISEIADQLNVTHVLEGSVRAEGDKLRVATQLIDAVNDEHIWSEVYERQPESIFAIQDEIATLVVRQIESDLLDQLPRVYRTTPEAYALFLQAEIEMPSREVLIDSIDKLERVTSIDPAYSPAWAKLSGLHFFYFMNYESTTEQKKLVSDLAERTLKVDPYNASAFAVLGALAAYDGELQQAAGQFERAYELNPNDEYLVSQTVFLLQSLGRLNEAIELLEYAADRNPLDYLTVARLALTLTMAKRTNDAETYWRRALELNAHPPSWMYAFIAMNNAALGNIERVSGLINAMPDGPRKEIMQAWYHQQAGDVQEFQMAYDSLRAREAELGEFDIIRMYALLGYVDEAFDRLNMVDNFRHWPRERFWPIYWSLEKDPRWQRFLERAGLSEAQLSEIKFDFKIPQI